MRNSLPGNPSPGPDPATELTADLYATTEGTDATRRGLAGRFSLEQAVVFAVALVVHGRSVSFGFVGLDDQDLFVEDAAFLGDLSNLWRVFTRAYMHVVDSQHGYYRPLITASYIIDTAWGGPRPFAYHLTNVVLHAFASVLFLALLHRYAMGRAALLGALVFAVHPALAANVAWIPGRNDALLTFFILAAWLQLPREPTPRPGPWVLSHLALFALALLTKETAFAAPAVWGLDLALRPHRPSPRPREGRSRGIESLLVAGWSAAVLSRLAFSKAAWTFASDHATLDPHFPLLVARSLGALVFPLNPSLLTDPQDLPLWPGTATLALAFTLAAVLAVGPTFGPLAAAAPAGDPSFLAGVRPRVVALGGAAFLIFLAPTLTVGTTLVLATRLYLPACGALLAAAEITRAFVDRGAPRTVDDSADRAGRDRATLSFGAVTVAALSLLAVAYESTFRTRRAFARAEVEAAPHSAMAHFCLGQVDQMDGDAPRALTEYRLALEFGATDVVHNNIAVLEMGRGDWAGAESDLRTEIRVNPHYGRAYRNLAIVLRRQDRGDEAKDAEARADALESP